VVVLGSAGRMQKPDMIFVRVMKVQAHHVPSVSGLIMLQSAPGPLIIQGTNANRASWWFGLMWWPAHMPLLVRSDGSVLYVPAGSGRWGH
jgi:hypothetical protein